MRNRNIMAFAIIIFIAIIVVFGGKSYYSNNLKAVSLDSNAEIRAVEIPKGSSTKHIASILKSNGLIRNENVFRLYCKLNEKEGKLKAGKYKIQKNQDVPQIVEKLILGKGDYDTVRFTIPEGYEIRQIADKLAEQGLIDKTKFEKEVKETDFDFDFVNSLPKNENRLEGYLYPDTYEIFKGESEHKIIEIMLGKFNEVYKEEFSTRAKELNMSMDEVITLASIIEREAKLDSERKIISGVFHNRLNKKMMLQSCATIQYILKERKEVLLFKDLEVESPYNTYKNVGLPPGPIASPGLKSIEAALYPEKVDYLYFVANKDGSHVFTKTYQEHLKAQNKINN